MKCTCGHEKEAHHRGVSTCINGGRCLCALYTPVDPSAEVEAAWEEFLAQNPNADDALVDSYNHTWWGDEIFKAGWNARS